MIYINLKVDYGKTGLTISLDPKWNVEVLKQKPQQILKNPLQIIQDKIKHPVGSPSLKQIIMEKGHVEKVCIVSSDSTRPVPSYILLEALINELNNYGIQDSQIIILIATGLHRPSREVERENILGKKLYGRIECVDHKATDMNNLTSLGESKKGIPICINKHYLESDIKILTGYVEPHFFFGFSGGCKSIVPGIAGASTIQANHSAQLIASVNSRFGNYQDNLMYLNSMEIARITGVDFIVNVCIDEKHQITNVAAGSLEVAHDLLVQYQLKKVFSPIKKSYDIVVCGNGGFPLDLNLYQAIKSMAIGEMGVKQGGTIISVNECSDGIGMGQDEFRNLLFSGMTPEELYQKILDMEIILPDQWEIQVLTRVLQKAEIYVVSELREGELGNIGLKYARTVEDAISKGLKKYGPDAQILILPHGPQIIPHIKP
ncbi:MAG: nickel-dependent lactate racemase [Candidatus Lokiarchaeota archaeon]|nr:nickel-dependent lactate racemase [Candidatus Lokiarchaeota archaeon]